MSNIQVNSIWVNNEIKLMPHDIIERWYKIVEPMSILIELDDLRWIQYDVSRFFWFDGRSGGKIPDLFEPNIGSQLDVIDWLIHDINAYDQYFSYSDTNEILRQMRMMHVSKFRAMYTKLAVSTSRKWFGVPKLNEREYINMVNNNGNITFNIIRHTYKPNINGYYLLKDNN